jgi:CHAT domain-containing protein
VHEILGLRARSPLVFLSGCETGLGGAGQGPFTADEDEGSIAQAFLVAGAEQVVATLWRIADAGAAEVAARFYRHFEGGAPAEAALAAAQRELISGHGDFTWAAYTVTTAGQRKSGDRVRATSGTP